jgi:hypothetical protein
VANPSIILAKTPMPPHRFQRLKRDFGVRYSGDTKRYLKPLRLMKTIPPKGSVAQIGC